MTSGGEFIKPAVPPKFFAIDIDGTFFARDEDALLRNINAFKSATDLGYKLFFCTARHTTGARWLPLEFVERTGYRGCPGVFCNGSLVVGDKGSIVYSCAFPREFMERLLNYIYANEYTKRFVFFDDDNYCVIDDYDVIASVYKQCAGIMEVPQRKTRDEILKMRVSYFCYVGHGLLDGFEGHQNGVDYVEKHAPPFTTVTPPGVTKARGLRKLCEHLGVTPEDVGFIGDGLNDIEIMQQSKLSFAVGNAHPQVKKHAKHVLNETCDEAAFAKAMSLVYGI